MKRLFVIRQYKNGPVVYDGNGELLCFDNKEAAKVSRAKVGPIAVVSFGPDHKKAADWSERGKAGRSPNEPLLSLHS